MMRTYLFVFLPLVSPASPALRLLRVRCVALRVPCAALLLLRRCQGTTPHPYGSVLHDCSFLSSHLSLEQHLHSIILHVLFISFLLSLLPLFTFCYCSTTMLRTLTARLSIPAYRPLPLSITFRRPYLPRLYSTQPPPPPPPSSEDKKQLYSYQREGPALDFKDDFIGDRDQGI